MDSITIALIVAAAITAVIVIWDTYSPKDKED